MKSQLHKLFQRIKYALTSYTFKSFSVIIECDTDC